MTDIWTPRLSEFIDGELTPVERTALLGHLRSCPDCTATVEDLRLVARRAATLAPAPPQADLWPAIAGRLEPRAAIIPFKARLARRFSFTVPQLTAAALALMLLSASAMWIAQHGGRATSLEPVGASSPRDLAGPVTAVALSEPRYEDAIADLEETLKRGRAQLDPETVTVIEQSLQSIDRAIEQSRQALAADPGNVYLNTHLTDARERKLALLRRAAGLVGKG